MPNILLWAVTPSTSQPAWSRPTSVHTSCGAPARDLLVRGRNAILLAHPCIHPPAAPTSTHLHFTSRCCRMEQVSIAVLVTGFEAALSSVMLWQSSNLSG